MNPRHATTRAIAAHRAVSSRGMTFLEVVAAAALLGVVAAAIFGVFGFVVSSQSRAQSKLAATEVANRLMLAYLDDPTHMPDSNKTLQYGPNQYRWDYTEQPLTLTEVAADQRDTSRQSPLSNDRYVEVTVRAWLSEVSGGARFPDSSTPMARLTRMLDPVAPRNPDSFMNMLQNPDGFQRLMEKMMGFQGNTVRGGTAGNPPGGANAQQGQNRPGPGQFGARNAFQAGRPLGAGGLGGFFGGRGFTRGGGPGGGFAPGGRSGSGPGSRVILGGGSQ